MSRIRSLRPNQSREQRAEETVCTRSNRVCESSVDIFVSTLTVTHVCNSHFESARNSRASTASVPHVDLRARITLGSRRVEVRRLNRSALPPEHERVRVYRWTSTKRQEAPDRRRFGMESDGVREALVAGKVDMGATDSMQRYGTGGCVGRFVA